jgi:tetratricopeptide (TPR) repeat protein
MSRLQSVILVIIFSLVSILANARLSQDQWYIRGMNQSDPKMKIKLLTKSIEWQEFNLTSFSDIWNYRELPSDYLAVVQEYHIKNEAYQLSRTFYERGFTYNHPLYMLHEAIADFSKAKECYPDFEPILLDSGNVDYDLSFAYMDRALAYSSLNLYENAINDFSKAIEMDPKAITAYDERGKLYSELKQYDLALADFTYVITYDPNDGTSYCQRGWVYYDMKQYDKSIRDFRMAFKLSPYHDFFSALGISYFCNKDFENARKIAIHGIKDYPYDAVFYILSGYCDLEKTAYDDAIRHFNKSISTNGIDPNVGIGLSIAYYSKGDKSNAKRYLEEAIRFEREFADKQEPASELFQDWWIYTETNKNIVEAMLTEWKFI